MSIRTTPAFLVLALVLLVAMAAPGSARAATPFTVTVEPPQAVPAGFDAAVTIRVEGDAPESADLGYEVTGGQVAGVVSLSPIAAGAAEGLLYVHRDTPGDALIIVKAQGAELARGSVHFAAFGQVVVTASLAAEAHASARTWRFEVLNSSGDVVSTLSIGTSGAAPAGVAASAWLPYGRYTVRQLMGQDTAASCSAGKFYAVTAPAGGSATFDLAGPAAALTFALRGCEAAPGGLGVTVPVDTISPEAPIDEVRGARQAGPLPPATGSGLAPAGSHNAWIMFIAGFALVLPAAAAGAFAAARVHTK